ncbi:dihydrolipoamide acetyltransferase family protein [Priestia filamentosa]|uniref:dihydrolipoamide acetyltransferase family protein n=1 Tax=Priestia filamentosa TaxID=1402861 RepID=UPI000E75B4FD|nr:dihydrolipoamide acetyltransferase family protein [Priestia filamentosa]RJS65809.1 dihydrolipoyllysine acetyltransferase [Priestia filamentosa]WCM15987.1 dihydrolipoamide acetyltransferase family protein [Priestia filamentosa]
MVEVKLHDIGEGMTEGEIIHYFVKAGDTVTVDQPLLEVQTDKMVAELPSPASGKVKSIIIDTGDTVEVGTTLLVLETEEGKAAESKGEKLLSEPSSEKVEELPTTLNQTVPVTQETERRFIIAAPYTRKVARKFGVDINEVTGTGKSGRITVEDVHNFVKERDEGSSLEERQETSSKVSEEDVELKHHIKDQGTQKEVKETMPFRGRRKQIAKKMTKSLYTIPHVTHFEEADLTELLAYRNDLKEMNMNISVAAFFIKAIAVALKKFPIFNAKLDEENEVIYLEKEYNIGIATDTEEGLIVPVIHHADRLSVSQIHEKLKELTRKAQEGKLTMDDMRGGTFTVSNVGPLGSIGATPIINHPETGLIAFHKTKKMPVVNENDEIVIRSMMTMSMAFDHRVADGATAVAFTNRFKYLIENPKLWPIELA